MVQFSYFTASGVFMGDTEELLRILPHLDPEWLKQFNKAVAWLKGEKSGNGQALVKLSGGIVQKTQWTFDDLPPRKNRP